MSSKFVKVACAVALSAPMMLVGQVSAHAQVGPTETECSDHASGAVTKHPGPDYECYGIDDAFIPAHNNNGGGTPATPPSLTVSATAQNLFCPAGTALQTVTIDPTAPGPNVTLAPGGILPAFLAGPPSAPTGLVNLADGADLDGPPPTNALATGDVVTLNCA